jgi:hypothetical protein
VGGSLLFPRQKISGFEVKCFYAATDVPYRWKDGTWRDGPEPQEPSAASQFQPKRREWVKRGFFTVPQANVTL